MILLTAVLSVAVAVNTTELVPEGDVETSMDGGSVSVVADIVDVVVVLPWLHWLEVHIHGP